MNLYPLLRPVLFSLDAERSHDLTLACLRHCPWLSGWPLAARRVEDPTELLGLRFRNRVGLAAGLDKDGIAVEAFDRMGFGFVEVGTVTPRPQPGNPRPRLFRLPRQAALINRMGFNNAGVDALVRRLRVVQRSCVLGVNIGKNRNTPLDRAIDDYLLCLERVYDVADYVVINISSPNTVGLRDLQHGERFLDLLRRLVAARDRLADTHGRRRPLLVKLSPDLDPDMLRQAAQVTRELGADGLIATNTTVARPGLEEVSTALQPGGLSGQPLRPTAEAALRQVRECVGEDFPLIGVGGIASASEACARRAAGADLVQIYTGLIYGGPALVAACARALATAC